jgi:AcrR family transcriptional regulator
VTAASSPGAGLPPGGPPGDIVPPDSTTSSESGGTPTGNRRTRLAPHERRAQLVTVAARLFLERGISATSVSDIVAAAGVAQGTFYWYFPSKSAILEAVADEVAGEFASAIETVAADPALSAEDKVRLGTSRLMEVVAGEARLLVDIHAPEQAEIHERLSRSTLARLLPPLTAIVTQGVDEGTFTAPDPELAAAMVAGALAAVDLPSGTEPDPEQTAHWILEFVLRGLGCRSE